MNKLISIISIVFGMFIITGCAWWHNTITNTTKLEAICNTTQGVAQTTISLVVQKNPDLKEWFLLSSNIIQVAVNNGTVQPTEIITLVNTALEKENIPSDIKLTVDASITSILTLYSTVYAINIESNMNDITKAYIEILRSACKGIDIGCGKVVAEAKIFSYKSVEDYTIAELTLNERD